MAKFRITFGLGGGFNTEEEEIIDADSVAEASQIAWEKSCDEYESYVGNYGLRSIDDIMDEDDVDEMTADEIFNEERESWLNYSAEPVVE